MPFDVNGFLPIGGDLGSRAQDFEVSEIPAYLPCGTGEHLYLWVEKQSQSTQSLTRAVQDVFHAREIEVGYAGKKDVHAITRQWISVQTPSDGADEIRALNEIDGFKVLDVSRHTNKLRMGHLRGNHFRVQLYGVTANDEAITHALDMLSQTGFINYFGKQRFGFDGDNVGQGIRILLGGRANHQMKKLYISALQSAIFNLIAARRFSQDRFTIQCGDVVQKCHAGCFICDDPETDNARAKAGEVVLTAALPGKKVMHGHGAPEALEQLALQDLLQVWSSQSPDTIDINRLYKLADGTRRALQCRPENVSFERTPTSVIIEFSLPAGSYATVFLRHLCGSTFSR